MRLDGRLGDMQARRYLGVAQSARHIGLTKCTSKSDDWGSSAGRRERPASIRTHEYVTPKLGMMTKR